MSIIITIIIFGIIVIIHEFGHFYVAKKSGVGIIEFAVGMGPKIFSFNKNGVLYSIRLLPLGGFCRMKGEEADDPDCFQNVSLLKRMAIVLAGPFMNFILAFLVFVFFVMFMPIGTTYIEKVEENSPAYEAGIRENDKIIKINNSRINLYSEITYFMSEYDGGELKIKIKNDEGVKTVTLTPKKDEESSQYKMGIACKLKLPLISENVDGYERMGIFETIKDGFFYMIFMVKMTIVGLVKLFTAKVGLDQVSGPVGLTSAVGEVYNKAKSGGVLVVLLNMANITGLLSANLGVMNLLPIPALDGGRFLFFIAEAIRGKKIPPEKEGVVHLIGFALLMLFGIVVAFNDILKFF